MRSVFMLQEMEEHLARIERRRCELEKATREDDNMFFADAKAAADRSPQFDPMKELLTAPSPGTS